MMFVASPYKISGFVACRKWYFFEYLDETIKPYRRELKKPRPFLTLGGNVHDALKEFMKLSPHERKAAKLQEILENVWLAHSGERGGFKNKDEEKGYYREALLMVNNFFKRQDMDVIPFYLPPENSFDEYAVVEWDSALSLGGKIDRIDKEEEGLHVLDYKSGKTEKDDNLQIVVYAIIAEKQFKQPVVRASFWYLRTSRLATVQVTDEEKTRTVSRVKTIVADIEKENEFPPHPGIQCYVCDYVDFCPAKEAARTLLAKKGMIEIEDNKLPF